jgi:hypothetical protein
MMTGLKMFEALKARADKARKPMTEEEKEALRERIHNSEFFKVLKERAEKARAEGRITPMPNMHTEFIKKFKEAREKAIANGTAKPMPKMDGRMAEVLKKMKEARTNKMNKEN